MLHLLCPSILNSLFTIAVEPLLHASTYYGDLKRIACGKWQPCAVFLAFSKNIFPFFVRRTNLFTVIVSFSQSSTSSQFTILRSVGIVNKMTCTTSVIVSSSKSRRVSLRKSGQFYGTFCDASSFFFF